MSVKPIFPFGGGDGGSITVGNIDGTDETILSTNIKKILWGTLPLGFQANPHPDEEGTIVIGVPAVFEPKLSWSNIANTQVRVAESDPNEPDKFDDGTWSNTVLNATLDSTPTWNSTLGRGLGPNSALIVIVRHANNSGVEHNFVAAGNGSTKIEGTTVTVTNYAEDGDGSAWKGNIAITVDLNHYTGGNDVSGTFQIGWYFTEHKFGETVSFAEAFFYDKNPSTPIIAGSPTVREHDTPSERVIKYLSGIGYYTTGSKFTIETPMINDHNDDTSHPTASLSIDSSNFGIAPYTSSPWGGDSASWSNVSNLDSAQGFDYGVDKSVDVNNFRHIGSALVGNVVRDSWNDSANVNSNTLKVCIDTVSKPSTQSVEYFDAENYRLDSDYNTAWDSSTYCVDGEAIVFGGSLYHGADLPRITENVSGALGSLGSLATFLPNETTAGISRGQPNYSTHTRDAVFFRKFLTGNVTAYPTMSMNILCNGDLGAKLVNGDIKIYVWKLGSIDPTSPNLILPVAYNPTNQGLSLSNSLWGHATYDFGTFDEGVSQTAAGSGMVVNRVGSILTLTFSGYNVTTGVLVRFQIKKGTRLDEVSVNFL